MAGTFNAGGLNAPPKSIVNGMAAGGGNPVSVGPNSVYLKNTLSGAVDAGVYKEILAVAGSGVVNFAGVYAVDTTSRTLGLKIVMDGGTVFDAVSAANTATGKTMWGIGWSIEDLFFTTEAIPFNSSLSILIKSSISETDKIGLRHWYKTT